MKKSTISILLSILLLCSNASAAMRFELSPDSDKVIGTGEALGINEAVKIIVLNGDAEASDIDFQNADDVQRKILYFDILTPAGDGAPIRTEIDFSAFESGRVYKVYAIPAFTSSNEAVKDFGDEYTEIAFASLTDRNDSIKELFTALNEDSAAVSAYLAEKGKYLGIDYEMFKSASADGVAKIMLADKNRLQTEGASIRELADFIDDAALLNILNNGGTIDIAYLDSLLQSDARHAAVKDAYLSIPDAKKNNILSDISKKGFKTYAELGQSIHNSVIMNAFNYTNTNADGLYKILCDYAETVDPKIDLKPLSKLSGSERSNAVWNLRNKKYQTVAELKSAIDHLSDNDTRINAPSGGGGGASDSSSVGGSVVPSGKSTGLSPFTDMDAYKWAEDALYYLVQTNIISGYGDGTFRPGNPITRAEFVKIIATCFMETGGNDAMPFGDVPADAWYAPYIATAYANNIVSGFSETEFGPERYITRQDMAVILRNILKMQGIETEGDQPSIADDDDIGEYAKDAVYTLKNLGIINGYEDGSFRPRNHANRAETVQMVYNFLLKKGELENEDD